MKSKELKAALLIVEAIQDVQHLLQLAAEGKSPAYCFKINQSASFASNSIHRAANHLRKMQWEESAFNFTRAAEICAGVGALTLAFLEEFNGRPILELNKENIQMIEKFSRSAFEIMESNLQKWEEIGKYEEYENVLEEIRNILSRA